MGFFGEEVSESKLELEIPEEYTLQFLQACLSPDDVTGELTTLYVQTVNEDKAFALCSLGGKGKDPIRFCSLQHEFGQEDSPLLLYTTGGKMHLTGSWRWTSNSTFDDDECSDESDDACEHSGNDSNDQCNMEKSDISTPETNKRKRAKSEQEDDIQLEVEKKKTRNKRGGKKEECVVPASDLVVVSKPPTPNTELKPWKVKPQNEEGHLVPVPKQKTLKTGVLITDYVMGNGAEPKLGSNVKITYEGLFPNGTVFDKNLSRKKPLKFRIGSGQVIRGLDLGMDKMRVGGSREIVIPPTLGYGKDGIGEIPGNQVLVFRISLIGIEKKSLSKR